MLQSNTELKNEKIIILKIINSQDFTKILKSIFKFKKRDAWITCDNLILLLDYKYGKKISL